MTRAPGRSVPRLLASLALGLSLLYLMLIPALEFVIRMWIWERGG